MYKKKKKNDLYCIDSRGVNTRRAKSVCHTVVQNVFCVHRQCRPRTAGKILEFLRFYRGRRVNKVVYNKNRLCDRVSCIENVSIVNPKQRKIN